MNILHNMPVRLIENMLEHGLVFYVGKNEDGVYLDLNTCMKSDAYLYFEGGKYIVRMRYDIARVVESLDDIADCVTSCMHGRDYMNESWSDVVDKGFPCGELSVK